jgi:chemotaxis protein methyltransferase CheR
MAAARGGSRLMTEQDFEHFSRLLHARSGFVLTPEKDYLVRGRLDPVARAAGLADSTELLARLRRENPEPLIERCVEAMAIHESSFFRDASPFRHLAETVLPKLVAETREARPLRIWCAACSSGQEPYSVAIVLKELASQMAGRRAEILATDLSDPILRKAQSGLYSDFEARRGLSPERLARWFKPEGRGWQVSPDLQQMITFRSHNLLNGAVSLGKFDIIFCRNVLIYFDVERKRRLLEDMARALVPGGALFLGSAETVIGVTDRFDPVPGASGLHRHGKAVVAR